MSSKNTSVIKTNDLNAEVFSITDPRKGKNDRLSSLLLHDETPVYSETPWLKAPFGVSDYTPEGGKTEWSINLSATPLVDVGDGEDKEAAREAAQDVTNRYFEQWCLADEMMLEHGIKHYKLIKQALKKAPNKEGMAMLYNEIVKGKGTQYPLRLQPKIPKMRDPKNPKDVLEDSPNVQVYKAGTGEEVSITSFQDLVKLIPKGSFVKAIILPKVWYIAGKYGVSLSVVQLLVREQTSGRPTGYAFSVPIDPNAGKIENNDDHAPDGTEDVQQQDSDVEDADGGEEEAVGE